MNNNQPEWDKYHERLLKKWSQMSKTYSILHSLCAQYYFTWHKRLGIPVVLLGGITASSIFSTDQSFAPWKYINGVLALFITALSGVSNFMGLSEKTSKHQTASFKYTKISMDIDTMLSFTRENRDQAPLSFIQKKKMEMLDIKENSPEPLTWILTDYLKSYDDSLTNVNSHINRGNGGSLSVSSGGSPNSDIQSPNGQTTGRRTSNRQNQVNKPKIKIDTPPHTTMDVDTGTTTVSISQPGSPDVCSPTLDFFDDVSRHIAGASNRLRVEESNDDSASSLGGYGRDDRHYYTPQTTFPNMTFRGRASKNESVIDIE